MNRSRWEAFAAHQPALFALVLLVLAVGINLVVQPNMFARETLNSNMRVFLPLILMAVGQAVVILGGGIDISVGGVVSIVNTVLATRVGLDGSPEEMWMYVFLSLLIGLLAGAINGFFYRLFALATHHYHLCDKFFICGSGTLHFAESGWRYSRRCCVTLSKFDAFEFAIGILRNRHCSFDLVLSSFHSLWKFSLCSRWEGRGCL